MLSHFLCICDIGEHVNPIVGTVLLLRYACGEKSPLIISCVKRCSCAHLDVHQMDDTSQRKMHVIDCAKIRAHNFLCNVAQIWREVYYIQNVSSKVR